MTGTFEYAKGDKRALPDFNVFFRYNATYPYASDAVWYLTQMRRWAKFRKPSRTSGITTPREGVSRRSLSAAAKLLADDGKARKRISLGQRRLPPPVKEFIDGVNMTVASRMRISTS